jgi:hypothetical protein
VCRLVSDDHHDFFDHVHFHVLDHYDDHDPGHRAEPAAR